MRYVLVVLALSIATPAPAQIRFFKDGSILVIGPTKEEKRRRQAGVMMGVMNNHPQVQQGVGRPLPPSAIVVAGPQQLPTRGDGH